MARREGRKQFVLRCLVKELERMPLNSYYMYSFRAIYIYVSYFTYLYVITKVSHLDLYCKFMALLYQIEGFVEFLLHKYML